MEILAILIILIVGLPILIPFYFLVIVTQLDKDPSPNVPMGGYIDNRSYKKVTKTYNKTINNKKINMKDYKPEKKCPYCGNAYTGLKCNSCGNGEYNEYVNRNLQDSKDLFD